MKEFLRSRVVLCLITVLALPAADAMAGERSDAYGARVSFAPDMVARAGREASLSIIVRNVRATKADDWIAAVILYFPQSRMVPLDPGPLPQDWQGTIEQGVVITYHAGHGASEVQGGQSVHLAPRVRNPSDPTRMAFPRIFVIPLASMRGFEGPALRAMERIPFIEVRPIGWLQIKR